MAVTPHSNEAFIREVDEEVRRDRLTAFWTRWGRLAIIGLVVALALFGGYLYWQYSKREAAGREGEQLQQAFDALASGATAQAQPTLATLARSDAGGYRALAKFTQADLLLQRNDLKGAAAKFAEVARDEALAQPFRDLALIRQTLAEYDTLSPQAVIERLRPLAVAGAPWLGSAGEMVAIAHLRSGRRDPAAPLFGTVARDEGVPESIRQRAVQMAGTMGVDTPTARAPSGNLETR